MSIKYRTGDALDPIIKTNYNIIVHCVNNLKVFGAGIALQIKKKYPIVYEKYKSKEPILGNIQIVKVEDKLYICNLFGQDGIGLDSSANPPIRYDAFYNGLTKLYNRIEVYGSDVTLHIPYLVGCGLAGGSEKIVKSIIEDRLSDKGINIIFYNFEG